MSSYVRFKSTLYLPDSAGHFRIKALDEKKQEVEVYSAHSWNLAQTIRPFDKRLWLQNDLSDFWIEVLLD